MAILLPAQLSLTQRNSGVELGMKLLMAIHSPPPLVGLEASQKELVTISAEKKKQINVKKEKNKNKQKQTCLFDSAICFIINGHALPLSDHNQEKASNNHNVFLMAIIKGANATCILCTYTLSVLVILLIPACKCKESLWATLVCTCISLHMRPSSIWKVRNCNAFIIQI